MTNKTIPNDPIFKIVLPRRPDTIIARLLFLPDLPLGPSKVLAAIIRRADPSNGWKSQIGSGEIMAEIGTKNTKPVFRGLTKLEQRGLIIRHRGGGPKPNRYELTNELFRVLRLSR